MSTVTGSQQIRPFLWFDNRAEEAMNFYTGIFPSSSVTMKKRWGKGSPFPEEGIMMGSFIINGLEVYCFDAGPEFTFNESVSFFVSCKDQAEIDHYWFKLLEGGQPSQCGWLKDKFGFSWQIVPTILSDGFRDGDPERVGQMFQAMMKMVKLDISELEAAYNR